MTTVLLFERFFDDAATFPPGLSPLEEAVSNHVRRKDHQVAPLVGPLVLPIDEIGKAGELAGTAYLSVSAVMTDQDVEKLRTFLEPDSQIENVSVIAAEVKLTENSRTREWRTRLSELRDDYPQLKIWLELPYESICEETLVWLKEHGMYLKFRTGGIRQELFPTPEELVNVASLAVSHGVPFKLTAGLHRAMRYTNPDTGFAHFGFLNIAAAIRTLQEGKGEGAALEALNSEDAGGVTATVVEADSWREVFVSFGTCSVVEPLETLAELDLYQTENIPPA